MTNPNPYQPPQTVGQSLGSFGDHAILLKRGFLYREIALSEPLNALVIYNGWNFLQRIIFNGTTVWKRISWVVIHRRANFRLPPDIDPKQRTGYMQIEFGNGLMMRRFTLVIDDQTVYDEWNRN